MYEEASHIVNEALGSIRTVASFCAEEKVMEMYEQKCEATVKQGIRIGLVSGIGFGSSALALHCTNALVFYIGAILVEHGQATFPQLFKVAFESSRFLSLNFYLGTAIVLVLSCDLETVCRFSLL